MNQTQTIETCRQVARQEHRKVQISIWTRGPDTWARMWDTRRGECHRLERALDRRGVRSWEDPACPAHGTRGDMTTPPRRGADPDFEEEYDGYAAWVATVR